MTLTQGSSSRLVAAWRLLRTALLLAVLPLLRDLTDGLLADAPATDTSSFGAVELPDRGSDDATTSRPLIAGLLLAGPDQE